MRSAFAALITASLLPQPAQAEETKLRANHPYVGLWVTQDGHIRHELLPNGRYVEARGMRERAYEGRYEVTGTHIEYWDDRTGFDRLQQGRVASGADIKCEVVHI